MGKFSGILICSDYDGTLASCGNVVEKNKEAIKYFTDNGGLFSVITGRSVSFLEDKRDEIGYNTFIGGVNGTIIFDVFQKKLVCENFITDNATAQHIKDIIAHMHNIRDVMLFNQVDSVSLDPNDENFDCLLTEELSKPIYKFLIHTNTAITDYDAHMIARIMGDQYEMSRSWPMGIEGQTAGINKGFAARSIAKLSGAHTLVCVGDYENDISMIREADIGYAVSSAIPQLKEVADHITVDVEDGVIAAIIQDLDNEIS